MAAFLKSPQTVLEGASLSPFIYRRGRSLLRGSTFLLIQRHRCRRGGCIPSFHDYLWRERMDPKSLKKLRKMAAQRARAISSPSSQENVSTPASRASIVSASLTPPSSALMLTPPAVEVVTEIVAPSEESPSAPAMVLATAGQTEDGGKTPCFGGETCSLSVEFDVYASHPLPGEVTPPGLQPSLPQASLVENLLAEGGGSQEPSRKCPREELGEDSSASLNPVQVAPVPELASLQSVATRLEEDFLSPGERKFVGGQDLRGQARDALNAMARIGHHLASFASYASLNHSVELRCAQERISELEHHAKQDRISIDCLGRELDSANGALQEADERTARRDGELIKAKKTIEELESRCARVQNDRRRTERELHHLKGVLRGCLNEAGPERGRSSRELPRRVEQSGPSRSQKSPPSKPGQDVDRLVEGGQKVLEDACRTAFSAGFEQCKRLLDAPKELEVTSQDEVLKIVVTEFIEQFLKSCRPSRTQEK